MARITTQPPAVWVDHFDQYTSARLVVANQDPYLLETDVPVTASIRFDVLDLGPAPNRPDLVEVWVNGSLAYNGVAFQFPWNLGSTVAKVSSPGAAPLQDVWQFSLSRGGGFVFGSREVVTVRVAATSTALYTTTAEWTFRAADIEPPEVLAVEASTPRSVVVRFNEGVAPATVTPSAFALSSSDPPYFIPGIADVVELAPYLYRIDLDAELSNGRGYVLSVSGVEDVAVPPNVIVPVDVPFTAAVYPAPAGRRFNLWSMVPSYVRLADRLLTGSSPGHTERFIQALQEIVDLWLLDVDTDAFVFDVDRAPEGAIDLLLAFLRNPFPFVLTDNQKRKLLRMLPTINASKHAQGLIDVVYFFLGIVITISPLGSGGGHWRLARAGLPSHLLPLYGRLGVNTRLLGVYGPFESWPYTFIVDVPVALTDDQRQKLIRIIEAMKAAHEHYLIREPVPPPPATWRLGVAGLTELGHTTRLGT